MKKRILSLVFIVALLAAMMVPSAVLAAGGSSIVSGAMPVGALTQFVVATIGTQTAGTAFTITTITAEDAAGNTVTTFTGQVALTETGGGAGGTVSPATSSAFIGGVLTNQSVTLTKAGSGVTITATNGSTGVSGSFTVSAGAAAKLQVLMPGETAAAGTTTGKTGSPSAQTAGAAVTVTVNAVDANWNLVSSVHVIAITSSDGSAVLPTNAALVAGTKTFSVTLKTASAGQTVTATDTNGSPLTPNTGALTPVVAAAVNAGTSTVVASPTSVVADGSTTSTITVTLLDAYNNPVSGKTVTLAKTSGLGTPTISAASGPSSVAGVVTFTVKSTTAASDVFTATDFTDASLVITATPTVIFTAGAVSASVSTVAASPSSVPDDGATLSTITVTLLDANSNPVSGKTVTLAAGSGSSTISAASGPSNASGVVTFTVKDLSHVESVTYTATDTTDTRVITQTATVSFVAASLTLSPPGGVSLSLLNAPATDQQIVGSGSAGNLGVTGLGSGSYSVTVSGSSTNLTGPQVLANPLLIATGNASAQIGNITTAASVTSGAYSGTDAAKYVPVTVAAQTIGTGIKTASFALNLYAFQKINATEAHLAGSYTLTLTYTATASF